jgi:sigma-B regulation protein RsbU (phosphoserine phosphatase)
MKVLAIEDQPIAALQLSATLRSLGHEVELVHDGETAWRALTGGGFRVVVSDWRMPQLDGLELCRRVRERGGDYVYFILISTTKITKDTRDEALAAGVDDFLTKPIDPDELGMRLHVAQRIIGFAAQVKQLESYLPICGYCKKVRDDGEYWREIEAYLSERKGTLLTHGICPDCYDRMVVPQLKQLGVNPPLPPSRGPAGCELG